MSLALWSSEKEIRDDLIQEKLAINSICFNKNTVYKIKYIHIHS